MRLVDYFAYSLPVFFRHKIRSLLIILAVAIGVTAVILLTSVGIGARHFIQQEFSSLGSELLVLLPGKKETQGGAPPIYGTSPRDFTLDDAASITNINSIQRVAPIIAGTSLISYQSRSREVITMGATPEIFPIRQLNLSLGKILPADSSQTHSPVIVLGSKLRKALFGTQNPIGEWVTAGDFRFRVIGVLEERGESLGLDLRDMAIIPARSAEMLFDTQAVFRVLIELKNASSQNYTEQRIRKIIAQRHEGEDDISFVSQDAVISALDNVLLMATMVVGAIAAISLVVAGVLIMNVTYISIAQREREIGLLKALGASAKEIQKLFLGEAIVISSVGIVVGYFLSHASIYLGGVLFPEFPLQLSLYSLLAASLTALAIAALFSYLPATRAAKLDPILALKGLANKSR